MFNYDRFEELRRSKGITKTFISATLGRSATLCQDWKQQKSKPSDEQLAVVAEILDTSPAYLLEETDDPVRHGDDELEQILDAAREREDMRMLFRLAKDATPEDVRRAMKIIEALSADD